MKQLRKKISIILNGLNIVVGCVLLGYVMFRFSHKQYVMDDDVKEYCVSMHYDS